MFALPFILKTVSNGEKNRFMVLRILSFSYIGLLIILPISAIIVEDVKGGMGELWSRVMHPQTLEALFLTFKAAFITMVINVVTGTAVAWVLVRYRFPFSNFINAIVDIPFAIPTVVTGIMLVVLYGPNSTLGAFLDRNNWELVYAEPGIILALLFVTFPFVVRTVQPVLMEMNRDMEEAAHTLGASGYYTFTRVVLPVLRPAILTGAALSFSRALGEFGAVVIVAGNIPFKTQVSSVYIYGEIESGNYKGALGAGLVLLIASLVMLLILNRIQRTDR